MNTFKSICHKHAIGDVISEPLIHSAYTSIKICLHHSGFGESNTAMYMIIVYTVGLYYQKSVRYRWRLVPCYARAGHICQMYKKNNLKPVTCRYRLPTHNIAL